LIKEFIPTEREIEKLLETLGADKKQYPTTLLEARKAAYLSQVTSMVNGGAFSSDENGPGQGGSPPASAPMTPIAKVVLTTLVAANIALAGYLAVSVYENWDKVQELLFGAPAVSETLVDSPEILTQAPEIANSPEAVDDLNGTPEPTDHSDDSQPSGDDPAENPQVGPSEPEVSTPEPDGKDNPGLHLGQTPHGPDTPPGQTNQDNKQDNTRDNDQGNQEKDKDKDKDK
jgi:hypothetical protein